MKVLERIVALGAALFAVSCGGEHLIGRQGSNLSAQDAGAGAVACSSAADCSSCLALSGCSWTGGVCSDVCAQDTDCYGPGNPAAPSCPPPTSGGGCDSALSCGSCLALPGCNWTGGMCSSDCAQDTDCYGPGNPAAPTCP